MSIPTSSDEQTWDDICALIWFLCGLGPFGAVGGAILLGDFRSWLVERGLLTTENVVLAIGDDAGLDALRIAILAVAVVIVLVGGVFFATRSRRERGR